MLLWKSFYFKHKTGKDITLLPKWGACRESPPQVQLCPYLPRERTVHGAAPLHLEDSASRPWLSDSGQGPLVVVSLLKVGSTIFLPSGGKRKA